MATLFPQMCESYLNESIVGRARNKGAFEVFCHNIRDYTKDKHKRVDDTPYSERQGMLMQAEPIYNCFCEVTKNREKPYTIYMSPKGKTLTQKKSLELSEKKSIFIICGHYEGVDQRVIEKICDEEISIGDYVLTGGELPALVLIDSVVRMLDGVLSRAVCFEDESHFAGLLEYPQYTRPEVWQGERVPEVLLSGHHANILKWRREKSLEETLKKRPELFKNVKLTDNDVKYLQKFTKILKKD